MNGCMLILSLVFKIFCKFLNVFFMFVSWLNVEDLVGRFFLKKGLEDGYILRWKELWLLSYYLRESCLRELFN